MAVEQRRFGSFTILVGDCKTWNDIANLDGLKLVGALFTGSPSPDSMKTKKMVFIRPASAKIGRSNYDEVLSWLRSLDTTSNFEIYLNAIV